MSHIDIIRNQAEDEIALDTISDSKKLPGYNQTKRSDYVDIRLKEGYPITMIEVLEDSNVLSFYLELTDISENKKEIKVIFKLIKLQSKIKKLNKNKLK